MERGIGYRLLIGFLKALSALSDPLGSAVPPPFSSRVRGARFWYVLVLIGIAFLTLGLVAGHTLTGRLALAPAAALATAGGLYRRFAKLVFDGQRLETRIGPYSRTLSMDRLVTVRYEADGRRGDRLILGDSDGRTLQISSKTFDSEVSLYRVVLTYAAIRDIKLDSFTRQALGQAFP